MQNSNNNLVEPEKIIQFDELLKNRDNFQIIDARSRDEWTGKDLHGNPRGGRIPGAVNLDWNMLASKDQKNDDELLEIVKQAGINNEKPIVTYCQLGVRATHLAAVLSRLGYKDVRVYKGSMSEWSRKAMAPMDTGE